MENTLRTADMEKQLRMQKESLSMLLNHMPAMTFSKDVETGAYLACNQAFADYANKETPKEVIGLTDFDLFEYSVAAHFTEDDRKALSMDQPYVVYEDVTDAVGNPRQFQTTKLKFYDPDGRVCLLGMSMDVTERERIKKERERVKAEYQKAVSSRAVYENIVTALSEDYFNLYYVDLKTDDYVEYGMRTEAGYHMTEQRGTDFFAESKKNAPRYIYKDDQKLFIDALEKETMIAEIEKHGVFIMQYRLLIQGEPAYVNLKAVRGGENDRYLIIGVNNIDSQVKDRILAQRAKEDRKTYLLFNALNNNLIVLYMVDEETDQFQEFIATREFERLGLDKKGTRFFQEAYEDSKRVVHPDDLELFHSQFTKDNILAAIEQDGIFVLDYRIMLEDRPIYIRLKAARYENDGKKTLIVGMLDEDAQIRREQKVTQDLSEARNLALVDGLTGAGNKYAYVEAEKIMNQRIVQGSVSEFSVVVFDLNDLKRINDRQGHEAGDKYIQDAYHLICTCFPDTSVFRIGGDEFTAILEGKDYSVQEKLLERFEKKVLLNVERKGAVVAFGCSRFNPHLDTNIQMVFERADAMMYQEKKLLKSLGKSSEEENAESQERVMGFGDVTLVNMRKHILIADDIDSNREILGDFLQKDYDILYAADGVEAMEILRSRKDEIAVVLLDMYMPNMSGRDVMNQMQVDKELMFIPVIFISIDLDAELDCLKLGAVDFIPKPYPDIDIIRARIARCIELSENRDLIRRTQTDKLTGLLNYDYFIRYVNRFDQHYKNVSFDAVVCNVNQFHAIVDQYGRQFTDLLLRTIGISLNQLARKESGIGCRREGDFFMLYWPHRDDYETILQEFLRDLFIEEELDGKVTLRFGVYSNAQREPDIEERFTCAKIAADSTVNDPQSIFGVYDNSHSS